MRILWLITRYWPAVGGAELHSQQLIHELARRGHQITVVTHWDENRTDWLLGTTLLAPGTVRHYRDAEAASVIRLGYRSSQRLGTAFPAATYYARMGGASRALAGMLESEMIRLCGTTWDLVHGVRVGREPLYVAGAQLARRLGVPFVFTPLHHPRWVGWRYRTYLDLYRRADLLVALTDHERMLYKALGVPLERVVVSGIGPVLPPSANGERFRALHQMKGPFVLFLGQKYAYKGYESLLLAARAVWQRWPEVTFGFLGPRTPASRRVFGHVRDARVLEVDTVDLQTKGDALAACDIFCLPSEQESFGGVYTEAWSYQKPVIGCAIPAVSEVVTHGKDGLLARPGSVKDLTNHLLCLLGDADLRARLGAAGRAKVEAAYTWERIAERLEQGYLRAQSVTGGER